MIRRRGKKRCSNYIPIDRATRLVDQLLTLSRLDSLDNLQDVAEIPLEDLLQSSVMDIYHTAQQAKIDATDTQSQRHQTHRTTAIAKFVGAKFAG